MASNVTTECGVCNEDYDDDKRCPRFLPCFHYLCNSCICIIASKDKKCPFCRQEFIPKPIKEFRINTDLLEFIKCLKGLEEKPNSPVSRSQMIEELRKDTSDLTDSNLFKSREEQNNIEDAIIFNTEVMNILQGANDRIEKDILPTINDIVFSNKKDLRDLAGKNAKLEKQLREMQEKHAKIQEVKAKVETEGTLQKFAFALAEAEDISTDLQNKTLKNNAMIFEQQKARQSIKKAFLKRENKISLIGDVLRSHDDDEKEEAKEEEEQNPNGLEDNDLHRHRYTSIRDNTQGPLTIDSLRAMSQRVKSLLIQGKVYAIKTNEGQRKYARISFKMNRYLCVHHLREVSVIPKSHIFPYEEVIGLADPSSKLCFLTLQNVILQREIGTIIIRLIPECKRAQNFAYLCSGELGPSYATTCVLKVCNRGTNREWVRFGDYESNVGEGGKSLVPGAGYEWGGPLKQPWLAGTVTGRWGKFTGDNIASQFEIYTKDFPGWTTHLAFGHVEDGLKILTKLHNLNFQNCIAISDCGIVVASL